jgi:hypothetical protein
MALAHQAAAVKKKPQLVAVIGAAGSGKTVYLGLLMDMLTRQTDMMRTVARGPLSISLQQTTTTALSTGWFPDRTPAHPEHWHWVHCQFHCRRRRRPMELVIPDISGTAFTEETEHSRKYPAIRAVLKRCAGVMVLADSQRLQSGDHSDNFVTLKLLTLLSELREPPSGKLGKLAGRQKDRRPLAIVLTKADACERCIEDPLEFATAHASSLLADCQSRFPNTSVFACSVAGACAHRDLYHNRHHVPLRIEPHGIVEPFGWLLTQISR